MKEITTRARMSRRVPLVARFEKYVDRSGDCWLWTGGASEGYGMIQEDTPSRQKIGAHRVAYELANGPIPEGLVIDHICHVKLCVNPSHLRAVERKQNREHVTGPQRNNKSGFLGVVEYFPGCWRGQVKHLGKQYFTGRHDTPEEADVAVRALRNELFTHNDHDRRGSAQQTQREVTA